MSVRIAASSEIQEIVVAGEWAYCWAHLVVTVTPRAGGPATRRTGHTLTILRRNAEGDWVVARDANMLTAEPPGTL
jgi:ketosteroid isomerase-like protein